MATAVKEGQIVEGPSKFDLMAALFDGKQVEFTFLIEGRSYKVLVRLFSVGREDGSNESWLITGNITSSHGDHFDGYFETRRRKGHVKVSTRY